MKYLGILCLMFFIGGCATWDGVKQDSESAYGWSKEKVQKGVE